MKKKKPKTENLPTKNIPQKTEPNKNINNETGTESDLKTQPELELKSEQENKNQVELTAHQDFSSFLQAKNKQSFSLQGIVIIPPSYLTKRQIYIANPLLIKEK